MSQNSPLSELEKCLAGEEFDSSDPELIRMIVQARQLCVEYNQLPGDDAQTRLSLLQNLLGSVKEQVYIDTPFYCDYGKHISIGRNVYIGLNCTFVDNNLITIGDNTLIGSGVNISTASHPLQADERIMQDSGRLLGYRTTSAPVHIGKNAWIGTGVTIISGVSIGDNTTIGAGSVVIKDIPPNSVAVGNPCRVVKNLEAPHIK